uniref:Uncharacterized protein n=1 Tax=Photinus pyralis TaxID=7054 RepID=A0A1Y1K9R8_PHOPY
MQRVNESKNKILDILKEFDIDTNFPAYLIDLLAYTGYSNHKALSLLDDEDIVKLEDFARKTLPLLLTEEEKLSFFGIFIRNLPVFCIVDGDKKLLQFLRTKCKEFEENKRKRLNTNDRINNRQTKKKRISETPGTSQATSRGTSLSSTASDNDCALSSEENNSENNERIREHIKLVVRSYQEKFLKSIGAEESSCLQEQATNDIIVEVKDDVAFIQCSRCDFRSKAYCEIDKKRNKKKWVLSNVNRHFKTHFKLPSEKSSVKKK